MEKKKITKNFFDNYHAHLSNGSESIGFYNDDYFLKIIKEKYLKNGRKDVILRLDEIEHRDAVTPLFLLYDKNKLTGYGAKSYMSYDFLDSIVEDESLSFKQRKELMIKLASLFEFFKSKDFAFYDLHYKNILVKDGDIKLIDLDGGVFKGLDNDGTTYDWSFRYSNNKIALLTLSFLFGVEDYTLPNFFNGIYDLEDYIDSLPKELRDYFRNALLNSYNILFDVPEIIDSISEEYVEETKRKLLIK